MIEAYFESFDIEYEANCNYDFLQVNDGPNAAANPIGKYCGTDSPGNITSTHDQLYFWFYTDASVSGGGFRVVWNARDPGKGSSVSTLKEISRIPGNPDSFQVISGKWKNFREIQDFGKSTKTCRKYDFYGMKKLLFFSSLASLARIIHLFLFD